VEAPVIPITLDDAPVLREPARQVVALTPTRSWPRDLTVPGRRFRDRPASRLAQSVDLVGASDAAPASGENGEHRDSAISRSASIVVPDQGKRGSDTLTPDRYVTIGRVPLLRQTNRAGRLEWQAPPLDWYRANIMRPESAPELFSVGEQDYVSIEGVVYAARDISETSLEVFNAADVALPPLPVEAQKGVWRFMTVRQDAVMEWLPTTDAAGFIRWRDGQTMIESSLGHYTTRYDTRLGMVDDDVASGPVPVHHDALTAQWHVGANAKSAAWQQPLYSRHPDLAPQGYPDVWESASARSRACDADGIQDKRDYGGRFWRSQRIPFNPAFRTPTGAKRDVKHRISRFCYQNRRDILLIDPWCPRKIIDFAIAGVADAAMSALLLNLKQARFGDFTERVGYSVQAFVQPRGGTTRGTRVDSLEDAG